MSDSPRPNGEAAIEFQGVWKRFGEVTAVEDLSLNIPRGTLFGCLGPNGAGKTTTIKMLAGILRPTAGTVWINGVNVHEEPIKAKGYFGYVPDKPYLYEKLTADELMAFVGGVYGLSSEQTAARTEELFEVFDVGEWRHKRAEEYSQGMKQKVLIAAAFVHDPDVLIIDEPMVGLDPKNIKTLKTFLRNRAADGTTIFLSTHSLPVAEELCDRISILHKGRLLADGTMADLRAAPSGDGQDLETLFLSMTSSQGDSPHTGTSSAASGAENS